jgi:hypothetical protein
MRGTSCLSEDLLPFLGEHSCMGLELVSSLMCLLLDRAAKSGFGSWRKIFGATSKFGPIKNLYTISEGLTVRCRVTSAGSARANFYNRQIMLSKNTHTPATYLGPWLSSGLLCPCNLQRLPPISLALLLEAATIFSAEYLAIYHIRDFEVGLPSRRPDIMTEVINEFL